MMLSKEDLDDITVVKNSKRTKFLDLFRMTPMDPGIDCQYADLRGTNFSRQNLRTFNFYGSDLTESKFKGATFSDDTFRNAKMITFSNQEFEELVGKDMCARYLAQRGLLANTYYQRLTSIGVFYMFYNFQIYNELAARCLADDKSLYVESMVRVIERASSEEQDMKGARYVIAKNLVSKSYPLDRRKLNDDIRWHVNMFPNLSAYFRVDL